MNVVVKLEAVLRGPVIQYTVYFEEMQTIYQYIQYIIFKQLRVIPWIILYVLKNTQIIYVLQMTNSVTLPSYVIIFML